MTTRSIKTTIVHGCALMITWLASASAFADPTLVNGSFESQILADGSRYTGLIDGWGKTFHGPVALVSGNIQDYNDAWYGVTPFGSNYVGLDQSSRGFVGGVSQTISGFVAGQDYVLSLYVADSDGGVAPQLHILLSNNSGVTYLDRLYDVPVDGPYGDVIGFTEVRTSFTASVSGDITLSLYNSGSAFNAGSISIDNVSIASVPEPGTTAFMLLGVGLCAAVVRRRSGRAGLSA